MVSIQGLTSLVPTLGGKSYSQWLTENFPLADRWDHQDLSGSSVLEASYTTALDFGRSVALKTYGDYVAGANWANSSGQIARHSAGSVETFQQDDILAPGKTYQVTITLANRTAGSVTITDGGAAISANEQTTRTITSTGTDFIITPTTDFDGDIDVAIILVQQTGILASSAYPGAEVLSTAGSGVMDKDNWTPGANGTLTNPGGDTSILRVAYNGFANPSANEDVLVIGERYVAVGSLRSDGSGTPRVQNGATILFTGTTSTSLQSVNLEFVATSITFRILDATSGAGFCEFIGFSVEPANPMNGATTVAQVGVPTNFGSLGLSVVDPGTASFSDIHSAEINSKFNPNAGFLNIWAKVSGAGVWEDGVSRILAILRVSSATNAQIIKLNTNNTIRFQYKANNISELIDVTSLAGVTDYFMLTMTWKKPGNMIAYINGSLVGTPQAIAETWVGNLNSAETVIGAGNTTPGNVWDGSRARFILGYEQPTDAEVLSLYNQGRR